MSAHNAQRAELLRQFLAFGLIGTAGFVVDSSALYFAMGVLGLDHYSGRIFSWFVAATFTWIMNRRFTFSDSRPPFRQWLAFLASQALGGLVNFGIYAAMVAFVPVVAEHPVLGVAAGAIAGLFLNFSASKYVVFRRTHRAAS